MGEIWRRGLEVCSTPGRGIQGGTPLRGLSSKTRGLVPFQEEGKKKSGVFKGGKEGSLRGFAAGPLECQQGGRNTEEENSGGGKTEMGVLCYSGGRGDTIR